VHAPIPAALFTLNAFDVLRDGEFVTVDTSDAAVLFYDVTGRLSRRAPLEVRALANGPERAPQFVLADGMAVWVVWGLDVFYVR